VKAIVTQLKVYDESDELIATLDAFDEDAFSVKWELSIPMADNLRFVADLIDSDEIRKPLADTDKGEKNE
jgi:hypothetical protein